MDLVAFVKQNAPYMTLTDLVEESGSKYHHITAILDKLGIKPIGQKQKIKNFILDHYKTKSKGWIAERCGMAIEHMTRYYIEMKIIESEELSHPPEKKSVRQILANYRVADDIHYREPSAIEEEMFKNNPEFALKNEEVKALKVDKIIERADSLPPDWKPDHPITVEYLSQFSEEANKIFKE